MDQVKKQKTPSVGQSSHVAEAASELFNEGKKLAQELYDEGLHKVNDVQDHTKEYTDELIKKVREKPLASLLIAAGVGFLLSSLLKK
jgi:ElaB/YqjD/DUF883 family membrane-anchored ribosome-binding protein